MSDEKDRFGDKLRDAEKGREDQYFADRDRRLTEKLHAQAAGQQDAGGNVAGHMLCPRCGERLTATNYSGITVDECPACRGMFLEHDQLQRLAKRESGGWLSRILGGRPR
jgi:hypothetical protein